MQLKKLFQKDKNSGNRLSYFLFTTPCLVMYTVFLIIPIILGFYYSFTNWNGIAPTYEMVGFNNYKDQLSDNSFHYSLVFTLTYAAVVVFVIVFFSFFTAVFLNGFRSRLKNLYKTLLFFPALIAPIVVSLIFRQIYSGVLPWLGKTLGWDFLSKNLMASMDTLKGTIEYVHMWYGMAIPVVLFTAGLQMVPEEIYEQAKIDGANFFSRLWHIVIPYMIPIVNIVFILTLKQCLMVYDIIMGLTMGGPGTRTQTYSVFIYRSAFMNFRVGYAASLSVTLFFIMLIIAVFQMTILNKKDVNAV